MITEIIWFLAQIDKQGRVFLKRKGVRSKKRKCDDGKKRKLWKVSYHTFCKLMEDRLSFVLWASTKKHPIPHRVGLKHL